MTRRKARTHYPHTWRGYDAMKNSDRIANEETILVSMIVVALLAFALVAIGGVL